MKIGIITFHSAENYGAFLQAYASLVLLEHCVAGADVGVLDYRPWYINNTYRLFLPKYERGSNLLSFLRYFAINLLLTPNRILRKMKFRLCQKKLQLISLNRGKVFLDYVYLGSDQIWNAHITKGVDSFYYGEGNAFEARKKVAYAVSLGEFLPEGEQREKIKQYCNKTDALATREKSAAQVIERITDKAVEVVLDPTLMIDAKAWEKVAKSTKQGKYIVVYQLGTNELIWKDVVKYAEEHGYSIISLNEVGRKKRKGVAVKIISAYVADPFEFVGIMKNAEFVFTDSFHGTCFSIIFRRQFATYLGQKRNERIIDLLDDLGLTTRVIGYGEQMVKSFDEIEYDLVSSKLNKMRTKSFDYLERSFSGERGYK